MGDNSLTICVQIGRIEEETQHIVSEQQMVGHRIPPETSRKHELKAIGTTMQGRSKNKKK